MIHTDIQTGYPSIDKPWLKYYSEKAINATLPECTIYEYMYQCNLNNMDGYALNYFGKRITYRELIHEIDKVANALASCEVKARDIVTVVSVSCVASIVSLYAINRIGAVANYVNVLSNEEDFEKYFVEANSKVVLVLDLFGQKVVNAAKKTNVKKIIYFSLSDYMPPFIKIGFRYQMRTIDLAFTKKDIAIEWRKFIELSSSRVVNFMEKNPEEMCLLGHTGGTTGFPKGVLLSDNAMNAVAYQYKVTMEHKIGETFLNCIIPFVVYGILTCLHMPLSLGLEVIVVPKFEAKDWKKYLTKNKPVHIAGIPSYVTPMLNDASLKNVDLSFVKTIAVGGDGLNDKLENQINEFLKQHGGKVSITKGYGMTEVCATAVTEYSYCHQVGSVGIPLIKNNIMVYDNELLKELSYEEVGEVCISSPSLMIDYLNNDEERDNLIKEHVDGQKWVHTGDLGYITRAGLLFISGRMKRMIFLGPEGMLYKVFPVNIEKLINKIPGISESCVVSCKGDGKLEALAYCVTDMSRNDKSDLEELIVGECTKHMPDYMIPKKIVWLDKLPTTSVGKVDFKMLEQMAMK